MNSLSPLQSPDGAEQELVAGAKRRDEAAIRAIIQLHNQSLYRLARGILPDADAEDAVQEAYLRALGNIASFRGDASLRTWLGRIVVNTALERLRRRRPAVELSVLEEDGSDRIVSFPMSAPFMDPERKMAQHQIRHLLEQAIDELPPAFRLVVMARLIEEMSVEETGQILGLKPETVKTRLHRARLLLRATVEKRLGPMLSDAFPFGDIRCQRMADQVVAKLHIAR